MNIRTIALPIILSLCGPAAFAQSPIPPGPKTDTVSVIFADRGRDCLFLQVSTSPPNTWYSLPYNDVPAMAVVSIAYSAKLPVTYEVNQDGLTCASVPMIATVSSGVMH